MISVDLHTAQIQGFFDGPVDHLFALPLLADHVEADLRRASGSPWSRRTPAACGVAERWTDVLGGHPLAFIHKTRDPHRPNEVVANRVVGDVKGRALRRRRRHDRHRRDDRRRPPRPCCAGRRSRT